MNKGNPVNTEPFVDAETAAKFLAIQRRQLLALARNGLHGAYSVGTGSQRNLWVFRLSELAKAVVKRHESTIGSGSPR